MIHIHPLQPIAVIVLIVVFIIYRRKTAAQNPSSKAAKAPAAVTEVRKRPAKPEQPPEVVYANLRQEALSMTPESLGQAGQVHNDEAYGVAMEMGMGSSVVTLACFADGDSRLYYKTGGGMIGGGGHERVRKAAKEFVLLAQKALPGMAPTTDFPLPETDRVRFYALTPGGAYTVETDRQDLGEQSSELSALFYSGQEVVTAMRQVQEQRAK
jgi:hypothetical protein